MASNPLAGLPLRYVIGKDDDPGLDGHVTEVGYDATVKPARGIGIKYCNLFDEKNSGLYGPYLKDTATAAKYGEGVIDPKGDGWHRNLSEQFESAQVHGFAFVELDNPDAYSLADVIAATTSAQKFGFGVIAKNPLSMAEKTATASWLQHPNVFGVIAEKGAGTAIEMDALRIKAGKPDLPVWFVSFGDGRAWIESIADSIKAHGFKNMGATFDRAADEYGGDVEFILDPSPPPASQPSPVPMTDAVPSWLTAIRADLGLEEIAGPADNPKIIAKTLAIASRFQNVIGFRSYCGLYKHDSEQAWCGLEAADAVSSAGYMPPFDPASEEGSFLWAASWRTWGIALTQPRIGAILCFDGHVAFLNRIIDADTFEVIGGNQSSPQGGAVTLSRRSRSSVLAMRWPAGAMVVVEPLPLPSSTDRPEIAEGATGAAVTELQTLLGGIDVDGEFGPNTDAAVRAFQAAHGLEIDGVVGKDTWGTLLANPGAPQGGTATLSGGVIDQISAAVMASPIRSYTWGNRGASPLGYLKGVCRVFADVLLRLRAGESSALLMASPIGSHAKDALAFYGVTASRPVDVLIQLFALLIGLGERESSGQWWQGRDESAKNTQAERAEAGAWQQSSNSMVASPELRKLFVACSAPGFDGLQSVFREGAGTPDAASQITWGEGEGAAYQQLCKAKPAFACMEAAAGLRVLYDHWGPIINKAAEIRPEAISLLQQVEAIVDQVPVVAPPPVIIPPSPIPLPTDPTLDQLKAAIDAVTSRVAQVEATNATFQQAIQQLRDRDMIAPAKPVTAQPATFDPQKIAETMDNLAKITAQLAQVTSAIANKQPVDWGGLFGKVFSALPAMLTHGSIVGGGVLGALTGNGMLGSVLTSPTAGGLWSTVGAGLLSGLVGMIQQRIAPKQ